MPPVQHPPSSLPVRPIAATLLIIGVTLVALWLFLGLRSHSSKAEVTATTPTFVGRSQCLSCHPQSSDLFHDSHHDLAMDVASPQTVLANFDNVSLEHLGVSARMFQQDGKYWVHTEGPDGAYHDYQVQFVFGVDPLQQYMVEFDRDPNHQPHELSRIQVLRWSWDTQAKKWFHLDPPDVKERIAVDDPLHWTGSSQRWNNMCADCHSTHLQKNYDRQQQRYATTFSEIDVSCESCHGPASQHLEIYRHGNQKPHPVFGTGLADLKSSATAQIESCAPCHSRRALVQAGHQSGRDYHDHFAVSWLQPDLYFADGQIRDEVYEHGSFLQSKMYHRGIRCTDCHDPHSARLKADGNQVCTNCHQHPTAKYDSVSHHFHTPGKAGSHCVDCHMPTTLYMHVDARHDHSLRIPRPDLSLQLGTPNACTGCHLDQTRLPSQPHTTPPQYQDWMRLAEQGDQQVQAELQRVNAWCNDACDRWHGESRRRDPHFAQAMSAAIQKAPNSMDALEQWLSRRGAESPEIARAAMLEQLAILYPQRALAWIQKHDHEESPIVRLAAASAFRTIPNTASHLATIRPFLEDSKLAVRVEAARQLALAGPGALDQLHPSDRDLAIQTLRDALNCNDDQAGALLGLGILNEQLGLRQSAIEAYQLAIKTEPANAGPRTNLAALLEKMSDEIRGSGRLELANNLAEQAKKHRQEELPLLIRDASLLPNSSELQYRVGLALFLAGRLDESQSQLRKACQLAPENRDFRLALILLLQKRGQIEEARRECSSLLQRYPNDRELELVWQSLR